MGRLRQSLEALTGQVNAAQKMCETAGAASEELANQGQYAFDILVAGVETLSLYLHEKAEKQGKTWAEVKNRPLSGEKDKSVDQFLGGITDGQQRAATVLAKWRAFVTTQLDPLNAKLDVITQLVAGVRGQIAKKRKKLLQSKKYKTKIGGYENTLNALEATAGELRESVKSFKQIEYGDKALQTVAVTVNSTYDEIDGMAGRNLATLKDNIKKQMNLGLYHGKKWRENHFGSELDHLKELAGEAEDIEKEPEDDDDNVEEEAPAVRYLKNVEVRLKTQLVAKAASAEYTSSTGHVKADLKWQTQMEPLGYLQKKFTVKGTFEDGDKAAFLEELKLGKLGGNMKTATFMG